jgi:hypothetical protein
MVLEVGKENLAEFSALSASLTAIKVCEGAGILDCRGAICQIGRDEVDPVQGS